MRSLGQEIVTELTYVSPSFAELIRTPKEALLGTSCTSYLMCDDDEAMRQYFEEMASWVTMRYTLPSAHAVVSLRNVSTRVGTYLFVVCSEVDLRFHTVRC